MTYGTIYAIKNTVNKKVYVGQTVQNVNDRFTSHKNSKECTHLANAMEKYGKDKFYVEELCKAESKEELDRLEIEYIASFDAIESGYNLRSGGSRGTCAPSTKALMSEKQRENWSNPATRAKHLAGRALAWQSDARRARTSEITSGANNPFFGRQHTEESKAKISATRKKKPVLQMDLNGTIINEFDSLETAGKQIGAFSVNISRACKTGGTSNGYRWKFKG